MCASHLSLSLCFPHLHLPLMSYSFPHGMRGNDARKRYVERGNTISETQGALSSKPSSAATLISDDDDAAESPVTLELCMM